MTCDLHQPEEIQPPPLSLPPIWPIEARRAALAQAIAHTVALDRMRVESQWDCEAVLVKGKRINHGLHLFLTVMTAGIWFPVWVVLYFAHREQRRVITIDDYGRTIVADAS